MTSGDVVLEARDLRVDYGTGDGALRAVDGVSVTLRRGEVLGIAGESGSGKSTLAYAMNRLLQPPGVITSGEVTYYPRSGAPVDVLALSPEDLRRYRWDQVAMVFQSAMNALNPVLPLRVQITDTITAHRAGVDRAERAERTGRLLRLVGIPPDRSRAYPHELSGGMRQRAMIAIALALEPEIIIMDEPTTALDVVMQRQILAELMGLRERFGFSVVFITHDLSLLLELADTISVMYAGKIVETTAAATLHARPRHPYSRGLLTSAPNLHGPKRNLTGIPGTPPDLRQLPPGCPFHPRCQHAQALCRERAPVLGGTRADPVSTGAESGSASADPGSTRADLGGAGADPGGAGADPGGAGADPGGAGADPGGTPEAQVACLLYEPDGIQPTAALTDPGGVR
jgi:oligopeptide/dipeptide ABC transporter ATP-binding protein